MSAHNVIFVLTALRLTAKRLQISKNEGRNYVPIHMLGLIAEIIGRLGNRGFAITTEFTASEFCGERQTVPNWIG